MEDPIRKKRPFPERVEPSRSWFDSSAPRTNPSPTSAEQTAHETVNTAYHIVDEYLRQGQKFAENVWQPLGSFGNGHEGSNAAERFMRAMGDMTMAWVEVMQQFSAGGSDSPSEQTPAGPFTAGQKKTVQTRAPSETPVRSRAGAITVSVVASGRVEVSVDLQDQVDPSQLVVTPLRHFSDSALPIAEPRLTVRDERRLELQVVVPEGQLPGTYNGLLLDKQTERPRGTINVVVVSK